MIYPPKYPRTPHWPESLSKTSDDKTNQNPATFLNCEVVITEKLDGGNTCLWNREVYARATSSPSHDGWMAMVRKYQGYKTGTIPVAQMLYGEDLYGVHSIEYDPMNRDETFRLFAARTVIGDIDRFDSWHHVCCLSKVLDIPTVPILFRGAFATVADITNWFMANIGNPSTLGPSCEGFVMRKTNTFDTGDFANNVVKFVRPNHVQTDTHWRTNWQKCKIQ